MLKNLALFESSNSPNTDHREGSKAPIQRKSRNVNLNSSSNAKEKFHCCILKPVELCLNFFCFGGKLTLSALWGVKWLH